jgi:hypothetical protein
MANEALLVEFVLGVALRKEAPDTAAPAMASQPRTETSLTETPRTVRENTTIRQALMKTRRPKPACAAISAGPLLIALPNEESRPLPWSSPGTWTKRLTRMPSTVCRTSRITCAKLKSRSRRAASRCSSSVVVAGVAAVSLTGGGLSQRWRSLVGGQLYCGGERGLAGGWVGVGGLVACG